MKPPKQNTHGTDGCAPEGGGRAVGRAIRQGQLRNLVAELFGELAAQKICNERKQEASEMRMRAV